MQANDLLVFGQVVIAFDGIGVLLPGEAEGGQGVFRRIMGRAAMGDPFNRECRLRQEGDRQGDEQAVSADTRTEA